MLQNSLNILPACCFQVKLLKCLVDNIVVDISFNQIGGLCTLTFLESIDRRVDQDHFFKKSIILVGLLCQPTFLDCETQGWNKCNMLAWEWQAQLVCMLSASRSASYLIKYRDVGSCVLPPALSQACSHKCDSQVKAWCYYESRVLGAHHGLISTYALETLVLYIFNCYHRHLSSPLEVRRKILLLGILKLCSKQST
jgi:hypothetical protein